MSTDAPSEVIEPHDLILDELAKLAFSLARNLAQRAEACQDEDRAARLSTAFERVSRSARHALALQTRLTRETRQARREDALDLEQADKTARRKHGEAIRFAVRRAIRPEAGDQERMELMARIEVALLADKEDPDFLDIAADRHIARICRALGLRVPSPPGETAAAQPADEGRRAEGRGKQDSASSAPRPSSDPGGVYPRAGPWPDPGAGLRSSAGRRREPQAELDST